MRMQIKRKIDLHLGSLLIAAIIPFLKIFRLFSKRDHTLRVQGSIAVSKFLGGGSLVIALPALLAIRIRHPNQQFIIITTPQIKPFAESLRIFDSVYTINDKNLISLLATSAGVLARIGKIDTYIDLEVHSRLSVVFALFSGARNRIGFYREIAVNRAALLTHKIYFDVLDKTFNFYEKLSRMLSAEPIEDEIVKNYFIEKNNFVASKDDRWEVSIGSGCSELSKERILSPHQWEQHFIHHIDPRLVYRINFLGNQRDSTLVEEIIDQLERRFPNLILVNCCGKLSLRESIEKIYNSNEFWGIDSSLLHYARLLGVRTISYFGPTSPEFLLKKLSYGTETINYSKMTCSPCVHVHAHPPCKGDNQCIKGLFTAIRVRENEALSNVR